MSAGNADLGGEGLNLVKHLKMMHINAVDIVTEPLFEILSKLTQALADH